ncbi:MAG: translation initiation factor IF-3 [Deltaproteobacteria bacterium]
MSINLKRNQSPGKDDLKNQYRINSMIKAPEIRLVGENMEEISQIAGYNVPVDIYNTKLALHWATELGKDLVEISPNAVPPVCKIVDFSKFIYQQKKKQKEIQANAVKVTIKEIRFGPNTDDHDFNFKLNHAKKFLEENNKVKAYVFFRGRAIAFKDRGELLLLKFIKELADFGSVENLPKLEGNKMIVIITPKKKK